MHSLVVTVDHRHGFGDEQLHIPLAIYAQPRDLLACFPLLGIALVLHPRILRAVKPQHLRVVEVEHLHGHRIDPGL